MTNDELKQKFEAALQKKKNNHFGTDQSHNAQGPAKTQGAKFNQKRTRRKSG